MNRRDFQESAMRPSIVLFAAALLMFGFSSVDADQLDIYGNYENGGPANGSPSEPTSPDALGDVLNSFPEPTFVWDLAFYGGNLWGVDWGTTLQEMNPDTGVLLSSLAITPPLTNIAGLDLDTTRNLFVVADIALDTVSTVDPVTGVVQTTFPSPVASVVGVAYDSTRDGYWLCDWVLGSLTMIDATTGATITSCSVGGLGANRIAGAAYSPETDRLVFNARDENLTFIINASDCTLEASFTTPGGPTSNNGDGAAIRPTDYTIYIHHYDNAMIYVVDSDGYVPVELESLSVE
jgi:hypothetical protein